MHFVRNLIERFMPKGRFGRGVLTLAGGTAAGQIVAIAASPILTRIYTPDDFGVLGVFTSIIGILSFVACLRFELAIPLPEDDADAASLGVVAILSSLVVAVVVAASVLFFGDDFANSVNVPALASYGWLLVVGTVAIAAYQVLNYWTVRRRAYGRIARTKFTQSVSGVLVQLGGSIAEGPFGLLLGQTMIHAAGSASLGREFWRADRDVLSRVSLPRVRAVARRYRAFPLIQAPASILNALGLRLPQLLIAAMFGASTAGMFALGTRVIAAPVSFVGLSISQAYVGELSRLVRSDPAAAVRLFITTARRLAKVAVVPMLLLIALSPWIFSLVFGSGWRMAGSIVQAMGFMYLVQLVVYPLSQTLVILEMQRLQFIWDAARAAATAMALWVPYAVGAGPLASIVVYGLVMAFAYVVHFLMMLWGLRRNQELWAGDAA